MVFSFSTEDFSKKMKAEGNWKVDINRLIRDANKRTCFRSTPKYRRDCLNGKRMLLSQARKVVESGFIKTRLDYEELEQSFHMNREQVVEALNTYYELMIKGMFGYGKCVFENIEEVFSSLVTDDEVVDYHWNVLDGIFESKRQYYAMNLLDATHFEQKECYYFCLIMTKLAGGDFFVGDGLVRVKSGFGGKRYVQAVYDLSWFLAGKIVGLLDAKITPSKFFGKKRNWHEYNRFLEAPAYILKVMEAREKMPSGVTTNEDIEGLFEECEATKEMLIDKVIGKGDYLDVKLLEWATKVKETYGDYARVL